MIDLAALHADAISDEQARLVLADYSESQGQDVSAELLRCPLRGPAFASGIVRDDCGRLWRDELPVRRKTRKRVDKMTAEESALMPGWAQKWVDIGLRTGKVDRPLFEAAVHAIYRHAGVLGPDGKPAVPRVSWCPAPIIASWAGAVWGTLGSGSVHSQVDLQVHSQVRSQVDSQDLDRALPSTWAGAIRSSWADLFGGQFWVGSYYWWGPAAYTFALDVLRLDIGKTSELLARAYAATCESACWWYPCRDVVFVSERPTVLERNASGGLVVARWEWIEDDGSPANWEVRP